MKKWTSMVLALCLLLCGASFAKAEDGLQVLDGWWAADAYRELYPQRNITTIEDVWDENGKSRVRDILLSGQWDAACIYTTDFSLAELNRLGLTLDLGAYPQTAAIAENLYPAIRQATKMD